MVLLPLEEDINEERILYCNDDELEIIIEEVHPADILDIIHDNKGESEEILKRMPNWLIANVIDYEEDDEKYNLLKIFSAEKQKEILDFEENE